MFKTLALATAVAAHEFTPYSALTPNGDFPAVTTPMTFNQNAGQENFQILMDQTNGSPDPPALGTTEQFTIAGLATHPLDVANLEFRCWLFGAKVYDEKFAPTIPQALPGTVWSQSLPFDVPGVAPSTEYDVEVAAVDAAGNDLFSMRTAFKF
jgi:hypothetical protein